MTKKRNICVLPIVLPSLFCVAILHAADEHPPSLAMVVTKAPVKSFLGEVIREDETQIEISDLKTGKPRSFKKADLKTVRKEINEQNAIESVGLPNYVAWRVNKALPVGLASGKIARIDGAVIYVSIGSKIGLEAGSELIVYRGEDEIKDPDTGEVLGKQRRKIANLQAVTVEAKLTKAKLLGDLEIVLEVGDVVETAQTSNSVAIFPLVNDQGNETVGSKRIAAELTTGLVNRGVSVIERQLMDKVLQELQLQQGVDFDAAKAQEVGKQLGAFAVVIGTVSPKKKFAEAQLRLVRVETGEIVLAATQLLKDYDDAGVNSDDGAAVKGRGPNPSKGVPTGKKFAGSRAGKKRDDNGLKMKFCWCPAGTFKMGSPDSDNDAMQHEKPQVEVTLSSEFWLGKHEVTQGEWKRVMGTTPWKGQTFVKEGSDYAATYVSWEDAVRFCETLSTSERKADRLSETEEYRLPTEAEWEYACRAGTTTKYSFGDNATRMSEFGWWGGILGNGNAKIEQFAHQVGLKQPNAWGFHDMHGNVWEWCGDWHNGKVADGQDSKASAPGTARGGSWIYDPGYCRSAFRHMNSPTERLNNLGFRVALSTSGK